MLDVVLVGNNNRGNVYHHDTVLYTAFHLCSL
jgi:hypothetical protein